MGKLFTPDKTVNPALVEGSKEVTWDDVVHAQSLWADALVEIGRIFLSGGDYRTRAEEHVLNLYGFENGPVLFKPTLAAEQPFRTTFETALSYFIGGSVSEDRGFALRPWAKVEFGQQHVMYIDNGAFAMGEYVFTPHNEQEAPVRVEFTFGYTRDADGALRICLHHSSLPYQPAGDGA